MALAFIHKNWKEGETARYMIRIRNQNAETQGIGRMIHCIGKNPESSPQNALNLINEVEIFPNRFNDHTEIRMDKSTMHPLQIQTNLQTDDGGITISAEYTAKVIKLQAHFNQEKKSSEIKISSPCFDNGQITWIFRALDFSKIKSEEFDVFNIISAQKNRVTLSYVGEEEVSVPAGLFSCYRLRMDMRQDQNDIKQFFLIDQSDDRLFVKNIMGPQTIELVSIS